MMTVTGANQLISDCQKSIQKGESRTRTLKGVKNLSRSDLEMAILYAQHALKYGSWDGLMTPFGECAELMSKY